MAIQSNFPAIRPSLLLDFANSKRLDPRITFTRASTARYYDGSTVAKAEENLFGGSQAFDGGFWAKTNSSVTADSTTAPDGTSTADTFNEGATAGVIHILQYNPPGIAASTTYAMSFFAKNIDMRYVGMSLTTANSNYSTIEFDLDGAGAVNRSASLGTGATVVSSAITAVGGSWFRCQAVITTSSASVSDIRFSIYASDGTSAFDSRGRPAYDGASETAYLWGAQLEQRSAVTAYTATTTAPITNYVPQLLTAQNNVARFDHNPTTGESLGLLIEEARTNLFLYSGDLSDAAFVKSSVTVSSNTIVAPDGTLTGDKVIVDSGTASASGIIRQQITKAASAITYTASFFAKAGEFNSVRVIFRDVSNSANFVQTYFNLATGTVASAANSGGTFSAPSSSISAVGNGWYRCVLTGTTGTETTVDLRVLEYNNGTNSITGDGYSGLYLWGYQLEAGAFATSYIPTTAASATRSADAASMTGTNFSSWYDAAEGTVYAEAAHVASGGRSIVAISDNTSSNRLLGYTDVTTGTFLVTTSGSTQANITTGTVASGVARRNAYTYKVNDFASVASAGTVGTDTSGVIPVVDRMYIGASATGTAQLGGTLAKLAFYPLRLTNAQLQAITG